MLVRTRPSVRRSFFAAEELRRDVREIPSKSPNVALRIWRTTSTTTLTSQSPYPQLK